MLRHRSFANAALLLVLSLLVVPTARAECFLMTANDVLSSPMVEVVFRGQVVGIARTADFGYRATFEVDTVWKGTVGRLFDLYIWERAVETPRFQTGAHHIVAATHLIERNVREEVGIGATNAVAFTPIQCSGWFVPQIESELGPGYPPVPHEQAEDAHPLKADAIIPVIGTEADSQAVVALVFGHLAQSQAHGVEFFLKSQLHPEWLTKGGAVQFVGLTDDEAAALLSNCGTYWIVSRVVRTSNIVSFTLRRRCGGTLLDYIVSFDNSGWHLGPPEMKKGEGWTPAGIGSGFPRRPTGCPCPGPSK